MAALYNTATPPVEGGMRSLSCNLLPLAKVCPYSETHSDTHLSAQGPTSQILLTNVRRNRSRSPCPTVLALPWLVDRHCSATSATLGVVARAPSAANICPKKSLEYFFNLSYQNIEISDLKQSGTVGEKLISFQLINISLTASKNFNNYVIIYYMYKS